MDALRALHWIGLSPPTRFTQVAVGAVPWVNSRRYTYSPSSIRQDALLEQEQENSLARRHASASRAALAPAGLSGNPGPYVATNGRRYRQAIMTTLA